MGMELGRFTIHGCQPNTRNGRLCTKISSLLIVFVSHCIFLTLLAFAFNTKVLIIFSYICIIILGHSDFDCNIFEGNKTEDWKVSCLFFCCFLQLYSNFFSFHKLFCTILSYYYLPF